MLVKYCEYVGHPLELPLDNVFQCPRDAEFRDTITLCSPDFLTEAKDGRVHGENSAR
jgi:hypothetical protein